MTAVLQNHARASRTPIDHLTFDFDVLEPSTAGGHGPLDGSGLEAPETGAIVTGLFLEGAAWYVTGCLACIVSLGRWPGDMCAAHSMGEAQ